MSRLMIRYNHLHDYYMIWHLILSAKRLKRRLIKTNMQNQPMNGLMKAVKMQDEILIRHETLFIELEVKKIAIPSRILEHDTIKLKDS